MYVLVPKYKIFLFTYRCIRIYIGSMYANNFLYFFLFTHRDIFIHPHAYRFIRIIFLKRNLMYCLHTVITICIQMYKNISMCKQKKHKKLFVYRDSVCIRMHLQVNRDILYLGTNIYISTATTAQRNFLIFTF